MLVCRYRYLFGARVDSHYCVSSGRVMITPIQRSSSARSSKRWVVMQKVSLTTPKQHASGGATIRRGESRSSLKSHHLHCSKYTTMARAQDTFSGIVSNVWSRPKRIGRSASYANLAYVREAQHDFPTVKRTSSYSSLAPSLTLLPQYDRVAERIVHTTPVYKPFIR